MLRSLMLGVALVALAAGVLYVGLDAVPRTATLGTLTQGIGTPDNPSREAVREAERNLIYLLGLIVGVASGLGLAIAAGLCWRLLRTRRPDAVRGHSVRGGGSPA